jgi:hypothetical protein
MGTKACPQCGEQIQDAALICRFCKADFRPAPPPMPARSGGGVGAIVTVIVVVVFGGIFLAGVLAALLLPAIARATRNAKATACCNNLSQLWKLQHHYMVSFGGTAKSMPRETGGAFWLKLSQLVDPSLAEIYGCPFKGMANAPGTTDYRGPAGNGNTCADGDPVGADKINNHGPGEGGSVLRKSGDVMTVQESDPLWTIARTKTSP